MLDALLVEAAAAAGAEVREAFTVEEVLIDDGRVRGIRGHARGGDTVTETAKVVVGADGRHSLLAKAVQPEQYHEVPPLARRLLRVLERLPADGFDTYIRAESGRGWAGGHTDASTASTCVVQGTPQADFATTTRTWRAPTSRASSSRPSSQSASTVRSGSRVSWARETSRDYFASRYGPDGLSWETPAITSTPSRRSGSRMPSATPRPWPPPSTRPSPSAARSTTRWPTTSTPATTRRCRIYGFTCDFAKLEPPPPEMQQLIGAMQGNEEAQDGFVSVMAGTLPAPEFFGPENAGRIKWPRRAPAQLGTAAGVAYGCHVAVVGPAAAAEHIEVRETRSQSGVAGAEVIRVAVVQVSTSFQLVAGSSSTRLRAIRESCRATARRWPARLRNVWDAQQLTM